MPTKVGVSASVRREASILRAAAKRLRKVAPKNDADIPLTKLRKLEPKALAIFHKHFAGNANCGAIPADFEGAAEYIAEIRPEQLMRKALMKEVDVDSNQALCEDSIAQLETAVDLMRKRKPGDPISHIEAALIMLRDMAFGKEEC